MLRFTVYCFVRDWPSSEVVGQNSDWGSRPADIAEILFTGISSYPSNIVSSNNKADQPGYYLNEVRALCAVCKVSADKQMNQYMYLKNRPQFMTRVDYIACLLVHGQVTIIFVVSVGLSVCLCRVFLSRRSSDFDETWTYVTCLVLVVSPVRPLGAGWPLKKLVFLGVLGARGLHPRPWTT